MDFVVTGRAAFRCWAEVADDEALNRTSSTRTIGILMKALVVGWSVALPLAQPTTLHFNS